jgi:hypothetical protein
VARAIPTTKREREFWRALATRQPWASLIADGKKTIEVRSWRTHYRGPLVIVASGTPNREGMQAHRAYADAPRSCLVALVDLVDVRPMRVKDASAALMRRRDCDPWLFSWVLENPKKLDPVPFTHSRVMTFDLPNDVRVRVAKQAR